MRACVLSLQKVIGNRLLCRHTPAVLRRSLEDPIAPPGTSPDYTRCDAWPSGPLDASGASISLFAELENRCDIATAVTVVRGRPYRDDAGVEHFFEAFHDELVGSGDEGKVIEVVKVLDDVCAEEETCTARGKAPAVDL